MFRKCYEISVVLQTTKYIGAEIACFDSLLKFQNQRIASEQTFNFVNKRKNTVPYEFNEPNTFALIKSQVSLCDF